MSLYSYRFLEPPRPEAVCGICKDNQLVARVCDQRSAELLVTYLTDNCGSRNYNVHEVTDQAFLGRPANLPMWAVCDQNTVRIGYTPTRADAEALVQLLNHPFT